MDCGTTPLQTNPRVPPRGFVVFGDRAGTMEKLAIELKQDRLFPSLEEQNLEHDQCRRP